MDFPPRVIAGNEILRSPTICKRWNRPLMWLCRGVEANFRPVAVTNQVFVVTLPTSGEKGNPTIAKAMCSYRAQRKRDCTEIVRGLRRRNT